MTTPTSSKNLGPTSTSAICPQLEAPVVRLPNEMLEHIFALLEIKDLFSLSMSCWLVQPIVNVSQRWISLFRQTFPYHHLNPAISTPKQYKQRYLTQRNWVQKKSQVKIYDNLHQPKNSFYFFQDFVFVKNTNSKIVAYEKNTMKKLYEFEHIMSVSDWYDAGDDVISLSIDNQGVRARVWEKKSSTHLCWIQGGDDLIVDNDSIFGRKCVGAGFDKRTQLVAWNKKTGAMKFTFVSSERSLGHVLHQNQLFAIINEKVLSWQTIDGSLIGTFEGGGPVKSFVVTDDIMISSHESGELRFWSKNKHECIHISKGHIYHRLTLDGSLLIGFGAQLIDVWDIKDRILLYTVHTIYSLPTEPSFPYVFDKDRIYLLVQESAIIFRSTRIEARNKQTGAVEAEFNAPMMDALFQIAVSEGRLFAQTNQDKLLVWDIATKKLLLSLDNIYQFHVENDCIFASTSQNQDDVLKVWDFRYHSDQQ